MCPTRDGVRHRDIWDENGTEIFLKYRFSQRSNNFLLHPVEYPLIFRFDGGAGRVLKELLTQLLSYSQRKREEMIFKIWMIAAVTA